MIPTWLPALYALRPPRVAPRAGRAEGPRVINPRTPPSAPPLTGRPTRGVHRGTCAHPHLRTREYHGRGGDVNA